MPDIIRTTLKPLGLLVLGASLSACGFEPPIHLPAGPGKDGYTAGPAPHETAASMGKGGGAQMLEYGKNLHQAWWHLFHSPRLDALVKQAMAHNPTLDMARAQLHQAEAVAAIDASVFYPQVSANLGAQRAKSVVQSGGGKSTSYTYSLFTGGVGVSYYPDIFGVNRLVYQGSEAQVEYQRYQLEAAGLSLSGNVVAAAIGEAAVRAQIDATRQIIRQERQLLKLTQTQYKAGSVSQLNVINQQAQLASSEAMLPPLMQQLAVYRHEMAILVGAYPSQWHGKPFTLAELHLPKRIPLSLPSELVKQRPDVQAAERQIRYAAALVGESRAEFFPTLQLTGNFGYASNATRLLFSPASTVWSLAASLVQPIFEGGKLNAQEREAKAVFEGEFANYRVTVLGAFQQVANALRAVQNDADALSAQRTALDDARQALDLAEYQYRTGATDYLSLLASEVQYNDAKIAYLKAQAQRYQDTASLLLALGGGWWHQPVKGVPASMAGTAGGASS
ncbi:efflux transporter outer membrane subunit [Acidihalobacter prosperus]|uniref:efflux transporter outer membrane subunit n=1 Tax=Acidihalobacter prosperus TaxID=160660 RepID=UPI00191BE5E7|nr:efflux transporter outer membrane subunit [Acidihalobacter prosperus]